ncbi:MAG: hypothetical protein EZS28_026899 [Streblomastix strix]|uniref:Uncharacterized protein n=1 Tax=Streblomastix strix TaxID=222440 RepID=A0A5J4V4P3_9EUKA|nr:MAG: hypothetical protein EZS28_026899 [Streblomastix strix]
MVIGHTPPVRGSPLDRHEHLDIGIFIKSTVGSSQVLEIFEHSLRRSPTSEHAHSYYDQLNLQIHSSVSGESDVSLHGKAQPI